MSTMKVPAGLCEDCLTIDILEKFIAKPALASLQDGGLRCPMCKSKNVTVGETDKEVSVDDHQHS